MRIQKLQSTVSSFEKQQARDQMIIKFRDSTIKRFNVKDKVSSEEAATEVENLREEITILKKQTEQDPQKAKIYSENENLVKERDALKLELGDNLESLTHQYR